MKKIRVLITGITGFAGSHLAEYALDQGVVVFGSVRWRSRLENIEKIKNKLHLVTCDLGDFVATRQLIKIAKPDFVFHLAAQSYVPFSWQAPAQTLSTNILGQLNLFEAVRFLKLDPVIQIACSSEEYGLVDKKEVPIKETNPLRPLSPYGVSKVAQDLLGYQYFKSYGLKIIRTRAFNHTGPRRGDVFVTSNFAKQIVEIESGKKKSTLEVGCLDSERDFSDVRDVVRAYWLAVQKAAHGEVYNICSGRSWTIGKMLAKLLSLTKIKPTIKINHCRLRPSDVPLLLGDHTKFSQATGWQPEIPFEQTLADLLNYWREKIKNDSKTSD